jgi:pyruvate/2-oxoglutarate dehydrogenase complex dihydrolipoamide dehydrogenase (E3) component
MSKHPATKKTVIPNQTLNIVLRNLKMTSTAGHSSSYDVAVLGGGSAGYAAARTTAAAGLNTVVIEGARALGGLCILRGCMPSKALLYAAEVLHLARVGHTWGLRIPKAGFNFKGVMARKETMVEGFARYRRQELMGGKFKLFLARARFLDAHALALTDARGRVPKCLTAKHFIISTGSVPAPPSLSGLAETGFLTSDEALALPRLPKSLIVLGGGLVAVELAQFFCRFDVKVTLIQRGPHLLRDFDADAAMALEKAFRREGFQLYTNTKLLRAFRKGREKGIVFQSRNKLKRVAAEEILLALGRVPATSGLGLDEIGVKTDYGRIATNDFMQTSLPHIYAAGDCTGPHQIVHIGVEQGEIAARNIIHPRKKQGMDYRLLCSVVFTDPQMAAVGLTERRASERNIPYLAASHPFNDHGKAMIMGTKEGFVKLLADPRTGEILGGACVGPMAGELIHEIIAAMHGRMTVGELAAMPHYHPTLAEIWTYPAAELNERLKA